MDKLRQKLMGIIIKKEFKPILEMMENDPLLPQLEKEVEEIKGKTKGILNPDLIVAISVLEEEIMIKKNLRTLVQDIVNLDWDKPETELEYESMKICFYQMNERIEELAIISGIK